MPKSIKALKENRDEKHGTPADVNTNLTPTEHDGYSQDEFEQDEVEVKLDAQKSFGKSPVAEQSLNKYQISMGEPIEGEDEIALQGLLGHRQTDLAGSMDLKSTSKFQDNNESFDKEFGSGDPDFDEAEKMAYNLSNQEERKVSPPASPNRQSLHEKRRA